LRTWLDEGGCSKHGRLGDVKIQLAELDRELYDGLEHRVDGISGGGGRLVGGQSDGETGANGQQVPAVSQHDRELTGEPQTQQLREAGRDQRDLVRRRQLHHPCTKL